MGRKIFIRIFFEKRIMLTIYIWIITMFTIFLGVESIFLSKQFQESLRPDIVVNGAMDQDGVMRYKMYNDLGNVPGKLEKELDAQPIVVRNLQSR